MVLCFKSDIKKFQDMKKKLKEDRGKLFAYLYKKYPDFMNHPIYRLMVNACLLEE